MTVYTGLLTEGVDGIPLALPETEDGLSVWTRFMVEDVGEEDECRCHEMDSDVLALGLVCSGKEFRWNAGEPVASFADQFTPPYVRAVCRG
jgi:hypothetical protein